MVYCRQFIHEEKTKTLIPTGWGWKEYPVATAVALKAMGGAADVMGMSRRRLPEFLESYAGAHRKIVLLGLGLSGDEPRPANALTALKKRGVEVTWVSALDLTPSQRELFGDNLKVRLLSDAMLLEAVGEVYGVAIADFEPYASEDKRTTRAVKDWQELVDTAMYAYRNYQDEATYAKAIRYLAAGVSERDWDAEACRAVAHYRRYGGREHVGRSVQMRTSQARINRIAAFPDARVLILGESGTGKETVALQIHNKSPRRDEPSYAFNCASVTPDLLEIRFFGHERGAFTGADRQRAGLSGGQELMEAGRVPDRLEDAIRMHIRHVYEKYGQNLTRAAEALDVSQNTMRKYL